VASAFWRCQRSIPRKAIEADDEDSSFSSGQFLALARWALSLSADWAMLCISAELARMACGRVFGWTIPAESTCSRGRYTRTPLETRVTRPSPARKREMIGMSSSSVYGHLLGPAKDKRRKWGTRPSFSGKKVSESSARFLADSVLCDVHFFNNRTRSASLYQIFRRWAFLLTYRRRGCEPLRRHRG